MYDYYLFPLPRASKWNRPIFDHSEVKIDLYRLILFISHDYIYKCEGKTSLTLSKSRVMNIMYN